MKKESPLGPVMVIGPVGAGKSTLLASLKLLGGEVKKTEAITYLDEAIDTPGEMLSIPRLYNALIVNSSRARLILFLMDGIRPVRLPSRLALALKAPVVGVITKIDLSEPSKLSLAAQSLEQAGVGMIFKVSSVSGAGLAELRKYIFEKKDGSDQNN